MVPLDDVIGIIRGSPRLPQLGLGVMVPESVALRLWGPAQPAQPAQMLIHTRLGAAQAVALQAAVALRPDRPEALTATTPLNPTTLAHAVQSSLATLLLALAAVAVTVGAIGIANTTLVAVMERASEIGLRRALGARPVHIAAQFLAESAGLGIVRGADRDRARRSAHPVRHDLSRLDRDPAGWDDHRLAPSRGAHRAAGRPVSRAAGQLARTCGCPAAVTGRQAGISLESAERSVLLRDMCVGVEGRNH